MAREHIVELLGGEKNLVRERAARALPRSLAARAAGGKYRLKTGSVSSLSTHLELPKDMLMELIDVRGRTAQRREQEGTLNQAESDRLYRVARVTNKAEITFGSPQKARDWLKRSNQAFDGATPLSLLGSDAGAEEVTDELSRIEYGDLY